jgi:hypothetical protein
VLALADQIECTKYHNHGRSCAKVNATQYHQDGTAGFFLMRIEAVKIVFSVMFKHEWPRINSGSVNVNRLVCFLSVCRVKYAQKSLLCAEA